MTTSRGSTIASQDRTSGSSSRTGVCKGWKVPFRRCYCGEGAPCAVSWSEKNPGRRYYGCKNWPDEDKECGYFEWYDDEASEWYKQVLNELKPKKKERGIGQGGKVSLEHLLRVVVVLLLLLAVMVGMLIWMVSK